MMNAEQPDTKTLLRMLVSAFGSFGAGLFLFALYISKPEDNLFLLILSIISILVASFILVAVSAHSHCPKLYKCGKLIDDKFIGLWVFIFSIIIASSRLFGIFSSLFSGSVKEPYNIIAIVILSFSVIFFIAYYVVVMRLPVSDSEVHVYNKLEFQLSASLCLLFISWLLMPLGFWNPTQYYIGWYGHIVILLVAILFLGLSAKNAPSKSLLLITALITTAVDIVLLFIGYVLSGYPWWTWVCFGFSSIAVVALIIWMIRQGKLE